MISKTILIADDHPVMRAGIQSLLTSSLTNFNYHLVFANDGKEALRKYQETDPDLIITDVRMPKLDGIQLTQSIRKKDKQTPILMMTVLSNTATISRALQSGVNGYLTKTAATSEFIHATQTLLKGDNYYSSEVAQLFFNHQEEAKKMKIGVVLTDREKQVLQLISKDYSQEEMADKLSISRRTIEGHARNLRSKLNVKSSAGLITLAFKQGLLE